ncbi:XRE family transcriptional regulator [Phenylobacterium sp. LjRoot164]|uniref:XRE family transcriptional regulator n=1 Tax=unclassified Phenylobacterium TaxID=2640670 RepID=UPI003ECFBFF0
MSTLGERLQIARKARGYETATDAAVALGIPVATYTQHENGRRGFPAKRAPQYARAFGVTTDWLLFGRGDGPGGATPATDDRIRRTVPVVGFVGAGSAAHFYGTGDGELDRVEAPDYATENTVAAEIRGESLGPLLERWLVFWDEVRTPVTPDLLGELCVVGLPDDRILVKQLRATSTPNHFHLISNNEAPMFDVEVLWAAKVKGMQPR